jgi:hypothetical protein
VSQSTDLVTALLEADASSRAELLRSAEPGRLESAIEALGRRRDTAAADVLAQVDEVVDDRALRKAARRELHRLRSAGVEVRNVAAGAPAADTSAGSQPAADTVTASQAWATDVDATGSRALWLLGERRLGGAWFASLLLNDQRGLQELSLVDTTRKRFQQELEARRRDGTAWVSLPAEYGLRLVREAVDTSRERQAGLPTRYHAFREAFGEAPGPPERALVHETISPMEATFHPEWLEASADLVREPELAGWHLDVPESFRERALELSRAGTSALLVRPSTPEQQVLQLLAEAAREALTPSVRRGVRRRLEETGYVFLASERMLLARLAVAAARGLEDPRLGIDQQPLVRMLLTAGLVRLIQPERVGGRRAAEALIELVERANEQRQQAPRQPGAVETRPSGLILPR